MKAVRPILLGVLLFAVFYYITSYRRGEMAAGAQPAAPVAFQESTAPLKLSAEEQQNVELYRRVLPSVVNIASVAVSYDFFYRPVPQRGQGSGFIIDKQGHILTNNHVVAGAQRVEVSLANGRRYRAQVVGRDPTHDLAVLRIQSDGELQPAVLGDSQQVVVGQKVVAIGNPFGLAGTMTTGIVSSIRSVETPEGALVDEAIQTDASINPGNSGGPLLNMRGEVIGVNMMILAAPGVAQSAGIGFAIPINAAKAVLEDLIRHGRVRRPALGIQAIPISPELADELGLAADAGVLIMRVVPGSAADTAGLRGGRQRALLGNLPILLGGDLIVAIDGRPVRDMQDLARIMNQHRAGDVVTVTVYRGERRMNFKVTLEEAQVRRG